jgi:hypothetical protein
MIKRLIMAVTGKIRVSGILILAVATILFSECSRKKNTNVSNTQSNTAPKDSSLLFNGISLDGWEITNFGPQGPVYVSGGEIILGMGDGCTGITWKRNFPRVNYKICLDAKRVQGNDFFCGLTFPAGKSPCTLIVGGWGGTTVGLSSINGLDAAENETTRLIKFERDRWYNICLVVKENEIKAWIDSVLVVDFKPEGKILSIRPEVELSKPFGIASWNTTAALKNIRLSGSGE